MRVEIDQADGAMPLVHRPQLSERDGMVAAHRQWNHPGIQDRPEPFFHHAVRGLHVPRYDREVARVDGRDMLEDLDPLLDVVRSQQARCFADRRGAEPPSDPIADRGVEWDPDEGRVHAGHGGDVG